MLLIVFKWNLDSFFKQFTENLQRKSGTIGPPKPSSGTIDNSLPTPLRKSESIDSMKEAQYGYPTPSDVRERYISILSCSTSIYIRQNDMEK